MKPSDSIIPLSFTIKIFKICSLVHGKTPPFPWLMISTFTFLHKNSDKKINSGSKTKFETFHENKTHWIYSLRV